MPSAFRGPWLSLRKGRDLFSAPTFCVVLVCAVLCAGCHYSPALDLAGTGPAGAQLGKPTMSAAMHAYHSNKMQGWTDTWVRLGGTPDAQNQACYTCHPGRNTKCLRGAMANLKTSTGGSAVECQSCPPTTYCGQ